jgi:glycosyltransferase involved in cell wall biosynthesis
MEGRLPGPNMIVRHGPDAHRNSGSAWKHFTWRREPIALKISHVPDTIVTQIRAQARHDPGILAAGSLAIPLLPHLEATDLFSRDGIDSHSIFTAVPEHPEVIFMIPRLVVGGAEKYTADMIGALVGFGLTRILILVTEQTAKAAGDQRAHAIFAPAQATHILFWPDICGPSHESPAVLARLLNVLRPKATVVVNSRVGLDMTAKFGRGLSQFSRLYCAYFSLGVQGLGAPYGTRFPRQTAPFAVSLTDNEPTAAILRDRYRDIEGPGVAVLPPCLPSTDDQTFTERLVRREKRTVEGARRWAWVSRIEEFKGTAILAALAELRPNDKFELFGPLEHDLDRLGLDLANVVYRGVLEEVSKADFSSHDGFLFTSLFEGMPNVVLEMSQHAIPMILADVGGLRDTFDDTAVMFVEHSADIRETAATFSVALDRTATLSAAELVTMLTYARNQALARHAADMHARGVLNLLGVQ